MTRIYSIVYHVRSILKKTERSMPEGHNARDRMEMAHEVLSQGLCLAGIRAQVAQTQRSIDEQYGSIESC